MSIVDSHNPVNLSQKLPSMRQRAQLQLERLEAKSSGAWKRTEALLEKATEAYLNALKRRQPSDFFLEIRIIYASMLIKRYNNFIYQAIDTDDRIDQLRRILINRSYDSNRTSWKLKKLFSQIIFPEPHLNLDSSWSTSNNKKILDNLDLLEWCGELKIKAHNYKFAQHLLIRFLNYYPELNCSTYLTSLRLTALLLSIKCWSEYKLSASELFCLTGLNFLYRKDPCPIQLIARMQLAFLKAIRFDVGCVEFINNCE